MTKSDAYSSVNAAIRNLETEAYCRGVELGISRLRNVIHELKKPGPKNNQRTMNMLVSVCNSLTTIVVNSRPNVRQQ